MPRVAFAPTWWLAALAMVVAGVSFYMLHNSMQTEATELAPSARGSAVALFACGFFVGQGLGPLVFAALLHELGPRPAPVAVAAAIVVLGRVVVAPRHRPAQGRGLSRRACRTAQEPVRRDNPGPFLAAASRARSDRPARAWPPTP